MKIVKWFLYVILCFIFAFVAKENYGVWRITHIPRLHPQCVAITGQKKEINFIIPLSPSDNCIEGKQRSLLFSEEGFFMVHFNPQTEDVCLKCTRWSPSGLIVVNACYEISDPEIKKKFIAIIRDIPDYYGGKE